jgi:hypothetical protein
VGVLEGGWGAGEGEEEKEKGQGGFHRRGYLHFRGISI